MRGLTIITQFWGDVHLDYLISWCIPSLLARANLPALPGAHRFIVACPAEDFAKLIKKPIVKKLQEVARLEHVPHEGTPPPQDACRHMSKAHKELTRICWQSKALVFPVTPDMLISNGTLTAAWNRVELGAHVVLTPALRFAQEELLAGAATFARPYEALEITGPELARFAVKAFHSETLRWEWEAPYVLKNISGIWTRHAHEGVQVHSLSYAPLALDYGVLPAHDVEVFEKWTMDGDYIYKNWGDDLEKCQLVDDSDEAMICGFTPKFEKQKVLHKYHLDEEETEIAKARQMCLNYWSHLFDPLKRKLFLRPVRWHKARVSDTWIEKERAFTEKMTQFVDTWYAAVEFSRRMRDYKTPQSMVEDGKPSPIRYIMPQSPLPKQAQG